MTCLLVMATVYNSFVAVAFRENQGMELNTRSSIPRRYTSGKRVFPAFIFLVGFLLVQETTFAQLNQTAQPASAGLVRVDTTHVINSFDPDSALGSSLDVMSRLDINRVFTPHVI